MKIKIKKGDTVQVISGKDRGKRGKVLNVFSKIDKILIEGVALKKRHRKPKKAGQKGEVVSLPSPVHISNAMLFCGNCSKGNRVGFKFLDDGGKVRICKKCKNEI